MHDDGENLPIPHRERNQGSGLEVYHGHDHQLPHPWRKVSGRDENYVEEYAQHPIPPPTPRRKIFNLSVPIFILSCILLIVIAGLVLVAGLLGNKVVQLEKTIQQLQGALEAGASNGSNGGGGKTLPILDVPGWRHIGCYYDRATHVLDVFKVEPGWRNMTNQYCARLCNDAAPDARHFGTETGDQCFCGTAVTLDPAPLWMCNQVCKGRVGQAEVCGGDWMLTLWERDDDLVR